MLPRFDPQTCRVRAKKHVQDNIASTIKPTHAHQYTCPPLDKNASRMLQQWQCFVSRRVLHRSDTLAFIKVLLIKAHLTLHDRHNALKTYILRAFILDERCEDKAQFYSRNTDYLEALKRWSASHCIHDDRYLPIAADTTDHEWFQYRSRT